MFWSGLEAGREAWKVGERSRRRRGGSRLQRCPFQAEGLLAEIER